MGGTAILVTANRTLGVVPCLLDSLYDFGFVCLVVFGEFSYAFR
jgi:hypothetical protein